MDKSNINYARYLEAALEMRSNYIELSKTAGAPDQLFSVENFEITANQDNERKIPVRLYTATENPQGEFYPLVLFVHGGGWVSGNLDTHDVLARALSLHLNAVVLSVDYRLAPEVDAVQQNADVKDAFLWLYDHAEKLKGDKTKIIGIGDSAGGALISVLSADLKNKYIAAQWLMYPVIGLDVTTESALKYGETYFPTNDAMKVFWESQLPDGYSNQDPRISPLFANIDDLPPTLISVAGLDPLTSSSEAYAKKLKDHGVESVLKFYEGEEHGFIQFFKDTASHPLGQQGFDDGIQQLKAWLKI
jgi:acetyl esterase